MPSPLILTDPVQWEKTARVLESAEAIAVDLEGNGYFRYPEHICLIQLAAHGKVYLLDPLALKDLSALGAILAKPEIVKIFHSCDWDLRSLDRDYGFHVQALFDTSIAARFLGINEVGLGKVLKHFLGVELDKSKSLQRQDWTLRPLNPESVSYAALDVFHLQALRDRMREQLEAAGRWAWVAEECRRMELLRYTPPPPPSETFWNIKGSRDLLAPQAALLRQLCVFREKTARQLNRPPFKVVSDAILLQLAQNPEADLAQVKGLGAIESARQTPQLRDLLKTKPGKEVIRFPKTKGPLPLRLSAEAKKRLTALKQWRQGKGNALGLDPSLIWPMRSLESLAQFPEKRQNEFQRLDGSEVREWQAQAFAGELESLIQAF